MSTFLMNWMSFSDLMTKLIELQVDYQIIGTFNVAISLFAVLTLCINDKLSYKIAIYPNDLSSQFKHSNGFTSTVQQTLTSSTFDQLDRKLNNHMNR